MYVVTVGQNKGGDGKTTLSRLTAEFFARQGFRVLAIDLDPQCNLSQRFIEMDHGSTGQDGVMPPVHPEFDPAEIDPDFPDWNGRCSVADIFRSRPIFAYPTRVPGLDILPGYGNDLREVEMVTKEEVVQRVHNIIDEFLQRDELKEHYDVVVIDTAPSKGPLTRGALRAATHLVIPCQMETQSVEGLQDMLQLVRQENKLRPLNRPLQLIGILANKMRTGVSLHEGIFAGLRADAGIAPYLIPHQLHMRAAFGEVDHPSNVPKSIFDFPENNPARIEAEAVCTFIQEAIFHGE